MKSLNRVQLLGHIGSDPEVKVLDSGTNVATFSIATTDYAGKNEDGTSKFVTDWHRVTAWNKLAEIIGTHCHKGDKLFIEGKLKHRSYDKDGVKVYVTDIVATDFSFAGGSSHGNSSQTEATATEHNPSPQGDDSDDLPY